MKEDFSVELKSGDFLMEIKCKHNDSTLKNKVWVSPGRQPDT